MDDEWWTMSAKTSAPFTLLPHLVSLDCYPVLGLTPLVTPPALEQVRLFTHFCRCPFLPSCMHSAKSFWQSLFPEKSCLCGSYVCKRIFAVPLKIFVGWINVKSTFNIMNWHLTPELPLSIMLYELAVIVWIYLLVLRVWLEWIKDLCRPDLKRLEQVVVHLGNLSQGHLNSGQW